MEDGLLGFLSSPAGAGLLSAVAGGMAGARRGTPWNNFGRAGIAGLTGYSAAQDDIFKKQQLDETKKSRDMDMQMKQVQMDQMLGQQKWRQGLPEVQEKAQPKIEQFQPDTFDQADSPFGQMQNVRPGDQEGLRKYLMQQHSPYADKIIEKQLFPKEKEAFTLGEGQSRFGGDGQVIANVAKAPEKMPSAVQEYEYAKDQGYAGSFKDFKESNARAGASNIKIDNKTGESFAKEIGPIAETSLTRARSAVAKVQQGDRILQAVDTGNVITGPGANVRLDALRLANVLGVSGENDQQKLANTQQVIKGLASITLETRQKLKGSGAITDKETDLLARAESGDINFTPTELRRLVEINRLSAKIDYDDHLRIITTMQGRPEGTIAPYFMPPAFPEPYQGKPKENQQQPKSKILKIGGKNVSGVWNAKLGKYTTPDGKFVIEE